jgi:transcriptional regulator with XRE-family HTH domain
MLRGYFGHHSQARLICRPAVWVQPKEYEAVGAALAAARDRAGLTQKQLARLLRKPQSFVSNYERSQRRIDVLELLRIVESLGGDPRAVFMDIVARSSGRPGKSRRAERRPDIEGATGPHQLRADRDTARLMRTVGIRFSGHRLERFHGC